MATDSQVKLIHMLKNRLGISDDVYRDMLHNVGATSSLNIPAHFVNHFIDGLKKLAIESKVFVETKKNYNDLEGREDMATPKQLRFIAAMWFDYLTLQSNRKGEQLEYKLVKKRLNNFLYQKFKISDMRFVSQSMVKKIIKALKTMNEKEKEKTNEFNNGKNNGHTNGNENECRNADEQRNAN